VQQVSPLVYAVSSVQKSMAMSNGIVYHFFLRKLWLKPMRHETLLHHPVLHSCRLLFCIPCSDAKRALALVVCVHDHVSWSVSMSAGLSANNWCQPVAL